MCQFSVQKVEGKAYRLSEPSENDVSHLVRARSCKQKVAEKKTKRKWCISGLKGA